MPRSKSVRMTRRANQQIHRKNLEAAFKHRVATGCSLNVASKKFGVAKMTLSEAFSRSKKRSDGLTFVPGDRDAFRVLTNEQETSLCTNVIKFSELFHGISRMNFRRIAYEYAVACNSLFIPQVWHFEQRATSHWMYAFIDRQPEFSLENMEKMRSSTTRKGFSKVTVDTFFNTYIDAIEKYQLAPDRIYNIDECSINNIVEPIEEFNQTTQPVAIQDSTEHEDSIIFVGIVNAGGGYIPPVFIIPQKRVNEEYLQGTIEGCKTIFQNISVMNGDCFLQTLQHIKNKTDCSSNNKIMVIMDNAEYHMNIQAINYAIDNGIILVTLPLHSTSKLQPMDVSVYGPFKSCYSAIMSDYSLTNPHTTVRNQSIPEMASRAWMKACTPNNVISGFKATGIWPINRNVFTDDDCDYFSSNMSGKKTTSILLSNHDRKGKMLQRRKNLQMKKQARPSVWESAYISDYSDEDNSTVMMHLDDSSEHCGDIDFDELNPFHEEDWTADDEDAVPTSEGLTPGTNNMVMDDGDEDLCYEDLPEAQNIEYDKNLIIVKCEIEEDICQPDTTCSTSSLEGTVKKDNTSKNATTISEDSQEKKTRKDDDPLGDETISNPQPIIQNVVKQDQISLFCEYVASKIRGFDSAKLQALAQMRIQQVLFEIEFAPDTQDLPRGLLAPGTSTHSSIASHTNVSDSFTSGSISNAPDLSNSGSCSNVPDSSTPGNSSSLGGLVEKEKRKNATNISGVCQEKKTKRKSKHVVMMNL